MSKYRNAAKDVVSSGASTHMTDNPNPNPNQEICQHCGAGMVDVQEYCGGIGYLSFSACSNIPCRYGIREREVR